jgi:hypothetical protein
MKNNHLAQKNITKPCIKTERQEKAPQKVQSTLLYSSFELYLNNKEATTSLEASEVNSVW